MTATRRFVDAMGRTVYIAPTPRRLVSLVPSLTEILFDFGCGTEVVGITDYCTESALEVAPSGSAPFCTEATTTSPMSSPGWPIGWSPFDGEWTRRRAARFHRRSA